jgi:hypothetical protein
MSEDSRDYLEVLEAAVVGAGLSLVPDVSKAAEGMARTTGQTEDGQVVWLESTEYKVGSDIGTDRLVDYVLRAPINRALPANLEIRPWKTARKSNRVSKLHGKGKFEPSPPEGNPVKGVRASDPSEVDMFIRSNWIVLSELQSDVERLGDWPVVTVTWTEDALPRFNWKADRRAKAASYHTELCASRIGTLIVDAETFTRRIN